MKRDMELVRDLLLAIEGGLEEVNFRDGLPGTQYKPEQLQYHYDIMRDHGLINQGHGLLDGTYYINGLTWEGHDFTDTVRDPEIWKKTKTAASSVGSVGFKMFVEIGKAYGKAKLQELGVPIP